MMLFAQWNYKGAIVKVVPLDLKHTPDNLKKANKILESVENPENHDNKIVVAGDEPLLGQWLSGSARKYFFLILSKKRILLNNRLYSNVVIIFFFVSGGALLRAFFMMLR